MAVICGIDDAGRGPVIGPMVLCGVNVKKSEEYRLLSIGAKDSKLLTPLTRERIFDQIIDMVEKYAVRVISVDEIDEAVDKDETMNLNKLEAKKMAEIANELDADEIIIDCPSNNTIEFRRYISQFITNKSMKIRTEHKADSKYTVVAAASVIAKVTRDREIEKIKKEIGEDFGSGYPSDMKTRMFLEKNWNKYPKIFRHSWASYKRFSDKKDQRKLGDF